MSEDDRAYYHRRAAEELACAQAASDERTVSFHYRLASLFLDLVFGTDELVDRHAVPH